MNILLVSTLAHEIICNGISSIPDILGSYYTVCLHKWDMDSVLIDCYGVHTSQCPFQGLQYT